MCIAVFPRNTMFIGKKGKTYGNEYPGTTSYEN